MRSKSVLLTFIAVAHGSQHLFSVHDDILAFPQYDIIFSDSFISEADAESSLTNVASRPVPTPQVTSVPPTEDGREKAELSNRPAEGSSDANGEGQQTYYTEEAQKAQEQQSSSSSSYEVMILNEHEYLCTVPAIPKSAKNETADAMARAEEEKELARATTRGWELLQEMQGKCMYFVSGWWSYKFCYNDGVKQFHQLPPQKGAPLYPPEEDKSTPSYILGRVNRDGVNDRRYRGEISDGKSGVESTELQVKGQMRYLVQKLGAGTICDLTGKERRIEVQFHCHPQSTDRIGWINEVQTCSYLMVIYTPRLCNDMAFLPPRSNQAHPITCQEILTPDKIEGWKTRKSSEAASHLLLQPQPNSEKKQQPPLSSDDDNDHPNNNDMIIIGGVPIGAQKHVGREGRRITSGAVAGGGSSFTNTNSNTSPKAEPDIILAQRSPKSRGGKIKRLSDEEIRRLGIEPQKVLELQNELMALAGDKGWRLEVVGIENAGGGGGAAAATGIRQIRGVIDSDDSDSDSSDGGGGSSLGNKGKKEVGGVGVGDDDDHGHIQRRGKIDGDGKKKHKGRDDGEEGKKTFDADSDPPPSAASEEGEVEGTEEEYVENDL